MEKIIVEKEAEGLRIDKFLAKEFFLYTRGEIIRAIKSGKVFVNDGKVKPSYLLESGDVLRLELDRTPQADILIENNSIKLDILFEDDNLLVINKPAGLQVHPDRRGQSDTLVNALTYYYPQIAGVHDDSSDANLRPGIVHRLDRDTSGVMVVAKNLETFKSLKFLFKERKIAKEYVAVVDGVVENNDGIIDKSLAKSSDYSKQTVANARTKTTVRSAITHFFVAKRGDDWTLLRVMPKTGRTHQIRIHLASIGHPIIGDVLYGKKASQRAEVRRQMLHASRLEFALNQQNYVFTAPLPEDIIEFTGNVYWH